MSRNIIFGIGIVFLVIVLGIGYYFSQPQEPEEIVIEEEVKEQEQGTESQETFVQVEVLMQNESGESGIARLQEADGKTNVILSLTGVPDDVFQPAHIHTGSCADLGGVKYPLNDIKSDDAGKGDSETMVEVPLNQLLAEPLAVNIHESVENLGTYVACGDIVQPKIELLVEELQAGEGVRAEQGDTLTVHYVGTLEDGTQFDSSRDHGTPFEFQFGAGQVISGWDLGLGGMRVGGMRKLTIPAELAYGEQERPGIPPNSTLIFEVELLTIQ